MELHLPFHGPLRWGPLVLHHPGGLWTQVQHLGKCSEQVISLVGFEESWFVYHSESWPVCAASVKVVKTLFCLWDNMDASNKSFAERFYQVQNTSIAAAQIYCASVIQQHWISLYALVLQFSSCSSILCSASKTCNMKDVNFERS